MPYAGDFGYSIAGQLAAASQHPEALPHELFLMNADAVTWEQINWRTRRRGSVARGPDGSVLPGLFPVFIDRHELGDRRER